MSGERFSLGRAIGARTVELVVGVATLGLGPYLQVVGTQQNSPAPLIAGSILTTLGGILISWTASTILAERHRADAEVALHGEVDAKLDSLSRVLGQAAGQISQAVDQTEARLIPSATGFALVSQANRMIYGQVNEISVIRGAQFDAARLLETVSTLDDLARQLSGTGGGNEPGSETARRIAEQLASIKSELAGAVPRRVLVVADVACPYCSTVNPVELGNLPGDTAMQVCSACDRGFNVHRAPGGDAFSRAIPALAAGRRTERKKLDCPHCATPVSVRLDGRGRRDMICPHCFRGLQVDPDEDTIVVTGAFEVAGAVDIDIRFARPRITCPRCGRRYNAPIMTERGYTALCATDRLALVVGIADYEALRSAG